MHNVSLTQLQQKSKTFMYCIQPDPCVSLDLNQLVLDLSHPVFDMTLLVTDNLPEHPSC
jgi:hypothetical protein